MRAFTAAAEGAVGGDGGGEVFGAGVERRRALTRKTRMMGAGWE